MLDDRYGLEQVIGEGAMAIVYRALDRKHGRAVAIKVIRPEVASGLGAARFVLETETLARLQHAHIVPLIDSGVTSEPAPRPYFVMPFVEGETLRQRLTREGPLAIADAVRLVMEIGDALTCAHAAGVVHRDVKPENVLLSGGHALVSDFGVARAMSEASALRLTATGTAIGTPAYMSPEQASGTREVDARSDQYSLACLLYELLGGQPPFTGPNAAAIMARHIIDPPPSLHALRPGVPSSVWKAIQRALSKEPVDRFATIAGFLEGLAARRDAGIEMKSIVVLPFANLSSEPENDYFADGLMDELIADLSKVRALRVVSRNSAMQLKGTTRDTRAIGRDLDVRYVLEGSVRKAGESLRVTAQLIDAERDAHLWADKYSGTTADVLRLQERLSRRIVDALEVTLTPSERVKLAQHRVSDPRALEYYQRARLETYRFTAEGVSRARSLAEAALAIVGPSDALYGLLGAAALFSIVALGVPEDEAFAQAEDCAKKAFSVNPESAEGNIIMGQISYRRGQHREAVVYLERARQSEPSNVDALTWLAPPYLLAGRHAAARSALESAIELDPLSPLNYTLLAMSYAFDGYAATSLPIAQRALQLDPTYAAGRVYLAFAAALAGQTSEWEDQSRYLLSHHADDHVATGWVRVWRAMRGERAAVLEPLNERERGLALGDESWAYFMAVAFALIDEKDQAFWWLEHAIRVRGWVDHVFFTKREPFLAKLRSDGRFEELMRYARAQYEQFDG